MLPRKIVPLSSRIGTQRKPESSGDLQRVFKGDRFLDSGQELLFNTNDLINIRFPPSNRYHLLKYSNLAL